MACARTTSRAALALAALCCGALAQRDVCSGDASCSPRNTPVRSVDGEGRPARVVEDLRRRGYGYAHFDSSDCFRRAAPERLRVAPAADFAGACRSCRGRIFVAPVGNTSSAHAVWMAACLPQECLPWQARLLISSQLFRRFGDESALWLTGEPLPQDCASLGRLPERPGIGALLAAPLGAAAAPSGRRVALCIYGQGQRLDLASLQSVRTHIAEPFSADVFALVDLGEADAKLSRENAAAMKRARTMLKALLAPRRLVVELPPPDAEVLREASSNVSAEEWRRFESRLQGRPVRMYHVLRKLQRLYDLVEAEEATVAARYDFIVCVRVDLLWLAPPPLHLMEGDSVWIPDGQDFGGLNDRWVVAARGVARIWFCRWSALRSGRLVRSILGLPRDAFFDPKMNTDTLGFQVHAYFYQFFVGAEVLLARSFDLAAGRGRRAVQRLPSTAALRCPGWVSGAAATPRCTEHGFRSMPEVDDAHNVVARLERGWEWTSANPWKMEFVPDYFSLVWNSSYLRPIGHFECCQKPRRLDSSFVSMAGYAACFPTEFFTYHRVCHDGLLSISLRPRPGVNDDNEPTCWRVSMDEDPNELTVVCLSPP